MERLIVSHARIIERDAVLDDYSLISEDGRIAGLLSSKGLNTEGKEGLLIDAQGRYLVPGFIDLHIHGFKGKLIDHGVEDLAAICRELSSHGVTAFLPAVTPGENECGLLRNLSAAKTTGAEVLGFLLEGHFLKLTGAIRGMINEYSPKRVEALKKAMGAKRGVFGISPEIPGILSLLPLMREGGAPAFITHTDASYEETEMAIEAGARHATHF